MGGIVDSVFGSEPSKSESQLPTLTPEQQQLLKDLVSRVSLDDVNNRSFGLAPSQTELTSLAGLEQVANNIIPGQAAQQENIQSATGSGLDALETIFTQGPQDIDDFFTATVQDPLLEEFQEDILPNIQTRFAPAFFGGERREAEARAREDLLDTLVRERARIGFEARESDQAKQLTAASILPGFGQFASTQESLAPAAQTSLFSALLETGAQGAGIRGRQLDERNRRLQQALGALGVPAFENVVTTTEGSPGAIGSAIGSALPGLFSAGVGALFSDERMKTDIEKLGETDEGLGFYKFRYKGDPEIRFGLMAQELEKIKPEATGEFLGLKFIDAEAA